MEQRTYDSKTLTAVAKHFEKFYQSEVFADIVNNFASVCELLQIQPTHFVDFYPILKANVKSVQGKNLFQLLDERTKMAVFNDNMAAANQKVMIIGAGPCGLRSAIEAQLLGAKVTVIEKRTSVTRNNVLHLWPWVIEDLKSLGAKQFYPRFCTGTMNHISIRRLQCILLKTALCFGVEVFGGVEFKGIEEPEFSTDSWRLEVSPKDHPVASRDIDVLIGAEGKRVTIPGFRRKEFRGKLAIAITANFVNNRTTAEAVVEEISGVAFVYKQDFFNNLYDELGIALENIVYYKDETHYFVMTTKKHSLLDRDVLKEDLKDPIELLSPANVNKDALLEYIKDACDYCTDYQLPKLEFARNHHNEPDIALFDFTSMFASGNACHVWEKNNKQLLFGLVGDGLLEPFWPTGTGIARGFLGVFDCMWMIRQWASGEKSPSEVMCERESILKLLNQTTHENISKDYKNVSIIPTTRYPNLNKHLFHTMQVQHLYKSGNEETFDMPRYLHPSFQEVDARLARRFKRNNVPANRQVVNAMRMKPSAADSCVRPDDDSGGGGGGAGKMANPAAFYQSLREKRLQSLKAGSNGNANVSDRNDANARREKDDDKGSMKAKLEERKKRLERIMNDENSEGDRTSDSKMIGNIMKDQASKAAFVKKMSKTFGYGMPSNAEVKKDTLSEEAEKCALLVKSSKNRPGPSSNKAKRKKNEESRKFKANPTREREIPPWEFTQQNSNDFNLMHSSVAPINPCLDINIDPELDCLLAQLEHDDDFSKLNENEQKAWLESLFYQDTLHCAGRINPRDSLNKTKAQQKPTLRVNQDAGSARGGVDLDSNSHVTAVHVNANMKDLAKNFFSEGIEKELPVRDLPVEPSSKSKPSQPIPAMVRASSSDIQSSSLNSTPSLPSPTLSRKSSVSSFKTPPTSRKNSITTSAENLPDRSSSAEASSKRVSSINESYDEISGVNKNLCSLAQSYFSTTGPKPKVTRKPSLKSNQSEPLSVPTVALRPKKEATPPPKEDPDDGEEKEKAHLVAAFFQGAKPQPVNKRKSSVPERASFEPSSEDKLTPDEDEEDDADLMNIINSAKGCPPDPPPRTVDKRALMMKMLSNTTKIMQGKRPQ